MRKLLPIFLLFISSSLLAQPFRPNDQKDFSTLIEENNMTFTMPKGFYEVPVRENNDLQYHYAMKDSATGNEMRYYVYSDTNSYENTYGVPLNNDIMVNIFYSILMKVSGASKDNLPKVTQLKDRDMKIDYDANNGALSEFKLKSDFGKGYTYCIMKFVHKEDVGFFFVFWMFNYFTDKYRAIVDKTEKSLVFNRDLQISPDTYRQQTLEEWSQLKRNTFNEKLQECDVFYIQHSDAKRIRPRKGSEMMYQYAVKDKNEDFEIRYYIRPIVNEQESTESYAEDLMAAISLVITDKKIPNIPKIELIKTENVQEKFNADWGGYTVFEPKGEFGKGYEMCSFNSIMKKGVGQIFIVYLYSNYKEQIGLTTKYNYSIKFKK